MARLRTPPIFCGGNRLHVGLSDSEQPFSYRRQTPSASAAFPLAPGRGIRRVIISCLTVLLVGLSVSWMPPQAHAALRVPVGVASVSTQLGGANFSAEAARIRTTGASLIRISAKWNLLQPSSSDKFNWATLDAAISAARSNGLLVLMNIEGPAPVWAQKPGADSSANGNAPANPANFGRLAQQLASRYSSRVAAWEIWNEPNISHYLLPPTAQEYVPLLHAAYTALRSAGANQPVVTGGLSSSRENTRDTTFIEDMYSLGAKNYFDGIGVHPYTMPYPISADPRDGGSGGGAAVLPAARSTMVANGDSSKGVWITEYGQPTGSTSESTSEAVQSAIVVDAVARANSLPWITVFVIFNSQDLLSDRSIQNANFGLYRYDGSPKPVVSALQSLLGYR